MKSTTTLMTKKLCRVRLIHWHYFTDKTIEMNGSTLITGGTGEGKSTLLDAIQMVLTTNTSKFNISANDKNKRDLKTYIRCKIGEDERNYLRDGEIISYVALEWFEEKTGKYFVTGARFESPDETSGVTTKWFLEECSLDEISFRTQQHPSQEHEFRKGNKAIMLISRVSEAKSRFLRRYGNLENGVLDIIQKAMAYKPMKDVREFITEYVLLEKKIEVETLKENINHLKQYEVLMKTTIKRVDSLQNMVAKNKEITDKDVEIMVNEYLLKMAELKKTQQMIESITEETHLLTQHLEREEQHEITISKSIETDSEQIFNLRKALEDNEATQLIRETKRLIQKYENDQVIINVAVGKMDKMITNVIDAVSTLRKETSFTDVAENIHDIASASVSAKEKDRIVYALKNTLNKSEDHFRYEAVQIRNALQEKDDQKRETEAAIKNLKNKKLTYPVNTMKLKDAIEKEFERTGIHSKVRIFSDLLEIVNPVWQNAVESYLGGKRFNLLIDPKHYKTALTVYHRLRKDIHSAGFVDLGKITNQSDAKQGSLAYVIESKSNHAKSYANYLLNRVTCCDDKEDLNNHNIAATADGMLYQGHVISKMRDATPYIGAYAYEQQLKDRQDELVNLIQAISQLKERQAVCLDILVKLRLCKMDIIEDNLNVPIDLIEIKTLIQKEKTALKQAQDNPSRIELQLQYDDVKKGVDVKEGQRKIIYQNMAAAHSDIDNNGKTIQAALIDINVCELNIEALGDKDAEIKKRGIKKYNDEMKNKTPEMILRNFEPYKKNLDTQKYNICDDLIVLQRIYCHENECDLGTGVERMPYYINELHILENSKFSQYYQKEDTIRIVMIDEAFDKMDYNKIKATMQYFNTQNYQLLIANPIEKQEVIGEYMDSVLLTIRKGYAVTVVEYDMAHKKEMAV